LNDLSWLPKFHGFLRVDKPAGMTSQDVITRLQHALIDRSAKFGKSLKKRELPAMGHGGTLDPFATGLLVVAVGDGVKLTRYLLGSEKSYAAEVAFGARTASGDLTNEVVARTDMLPRDRAALEKAAASFLGTPYLQIPPMYSAKKIEGVPLYEMARKGIEVERAAIACQVTEFSVGETRGTVNGVSSAQILARVTSGTFIRTLAEDFATRMESLAHLTALRRLASGVLKLEDALPLDAFATALGEDRSWSDLPAFIPFHRAILGILPRQELDDNTAKRVFAGEVRTIEGLALTGKGSIALYCQDHLVAIVRDGDAELGTRRSIERAFTLRFQD
jgi:tRNA pseudouridine55 synthase